MVADYQGCEHQGRVAQSGQSPLLAPNGPADRGDQCLLTEVKQTQCGHAATSETEPKRTPIRQYPFANLFENLSTHTFSRTQATYLICGVRWKDAR